MTDATVRPATIACTAAVTIGVDEAAREAWRYQEARRMALVRVAVLKARALALGGNKAARAALDARWAGAKTDAGDHADGMLFPGQRPHGDHRPPTGGARS